MPIEQKGIELVINCMKKNIDQYKNINVIPLNVHKNNEIEVEDGSKILIFDDTCYTGETILKAINKIKGNNLIIDKATYIIRSEAANLVDYYSESIDASDWFNDKRPLELKYVKIKSVPYLKSYPTIRLTISDTISKKKFSNIMKKHGFSKISKINAKEVTLYDRIINKSSNCSIIKSKMYYEVLIYQIGTNIYISFINDNDNIINSNCRDITISEFNDLDCFDCEYLEFINTYFNELHPLIQSSLLEYYIKIVDQSSYFESIFIRHKEKDLTYITFLIKVLFN